MFQDPDVSGHGCFRTWTSRPGSWPGNTVPGVGGNFRCACDKGDDGRTFNRETNRWKDGRQMVGFLHSRTGTHTGGQPVSSTVRACTSRGKPDGNRNLAARHSVAHTGIFTMRVYGRLCVHNFEHCVLFGPGVSTDAGLQRASLRHRQQKRLQRHIPAEAEWCEFTITAN